jgi:predicted nucleic acid-binding protein
MGAIKTSPVVYLDTNILIHLSEGSKERQEAISKALAPFEAAGAQFVTSELTLTEVMVLPIRSGNEKQISIYEQLFQDFVRLVPITRETLLLAAQARAHSPALRTPDALHVATATLTHAEVFATCDLGIKQLPQGMRLINP